MSNYLNEKEYKFGIFFKTLTFLSAFTGVFFQLYARNFVNGATIFRAFTTQSNIWIGSLCLVFLILDIKNKGLREYPVWLYNLKFMFTTSIILTYIVFAVLLTPLMSFSYLVSPSNIFLHVLTPIFAVIDYLVCDKGINKDKKYTYILPLIMPLLYAVFFISLYEILDELPVEYFFLDYRTYGWFDFRNNGIGVVYWTVIQCSFLVIIGRFLLNLKNKTKTINTKMLVLVTLLIMLGITASTVLVSLL